MTSLSTLEKPRVRGACLDCQANLIASSVWLQMSQEDRDYWSRRRYARKDCRGLCHTCLSARLRSGRALPEKDAWSPQRWAQEWEEFPKDLSRTLSAHVRAFAEHHGKDRKTASRALRSLGLPEAWEGYP